MLNHISIWFIHEVCFGVKMKRILWLGSSKNSFRLGMVCRIPSLRLVPSSASLTHRSPTKRTRPSDMWVFSWSVTNTHPAVGIGVHDAPDVRDEVLLGPRWANAWFDHLPGCDDEVGDQAERAMALVLELDLLDVTRARRLRWVYPLQRLDAGLLVGTDDVRSNLRQGGRLAIDLADILDVLLIGNGVLELVFRRQPVPALVGAN